MRTYETIAAREDDNLDRIDLYREGLFYRAYERSAYLCVTHVAKFKPSRRRVVYLGRDVVSIGFPAAALDRYFPDLSLRQGSGTLSDPLVVGRCETLDTGDFEVWKNSLPLKTSQPRPPGNPSPRTAEPPAASAGTSPETAPSASPELPPDPPVQSLAGNCPAALRLIRRIRDFRLEAATPLQCVAFIDELKRDLDGSL